MKTCLGNMLTRRFFGLCCLLVNVSGCGTVPQQDAASTEAWQLRQQVIKSQPHWRATGRLSLVTEDEAWNAHLLWQQQDEHYRIRLSAPMGQGSLELLGSPTAVILKNAGHPPLQAQNAETLLHQQTGWHLPLAGLRYWLLGSAAPEGEVSELSFDTAGQPSSLTQHGWQIDYHGYVEVASQLYLPRKLFLQNGPLSARILIRQWTLGLEQ